MRIDTRSLAVFFILISFSYAFSPLISEIFFDFQPVGLLLFILVALLLIICVSLGFLPYRRFILINTIHLRGFRSLLFGLLLLFSLLSTMLAIYGSMEEAIFRSYMSRTGVILPGVIAFFYYPMLVTISAYISLAISEFMFFKNTDLFYRYANIIVAILFLLIFLASGNRNLMLWGLSLPIALYVGTRPWTKIALLVSAMIFLSVMVASFRNFGLENLSDFIFPEYEYWNPIVHEYGTPYRVYDLIVNKGSRVVGYDIFGQSYLDSIINLLPSFIKPDGFISFSNMISLQYGSNGEGLGNSPVAEVIYNGYFPALLLQVFPFYILIFFTRLKGGYQYSNVTEIVKYAAFAGLIIATFNFWRIGNGELIKILFSVLIGFFMASVAMIRRKAT